MADILTSLHGSKIGLTKDNDLVIQNVQTGAQQIVLRAPGNKVAAPAAATDLVLTPDENAGRTTNIKDANGVAIVLPAATGTGNKYRLHIGTTITSNTTTIKVANATDVMAGVAMQAADGGNTINGWETAADTDTITLDGSTRGGIKGDVIELEDIEAGLWNVFIRGAATGVEATPFSATVS